MNTIDLQCSSGAIFSGDRRYRYALWRVWVEQPKLLFAIGLNPSTADESLFDPTIIRLCERAKRNGFGGLLMGNLYAFVSAYPTALKGQDAIGAETDHWLKRMAAMSKCHLVCWGSFNAVRIRAPIVFNMLSNPVCLGTNADGEPKHPLYLSYKRELRPYIPKEVAR